MFSQSLDTSPLQEATRMNALLVEMKRSMDELLLGLDGALNMSEKMEALAKGISTNSVPALWMGQMSTRVQEVSAGGQL
jgi:dynein heavy chain